MCAEVVEVSVEKVLILVLETVVMSEAVGEGLAGCEKLAKLSYCFILILRANVAVLLSSFCDLVFLLLHLRSLRDIVG